MRRMYSQSQLEEIVKKVSPITANEDGNIELTVHGVKYEFKNDGIYRDGVKISD